MFEKVTPESVGLSSRQIRKYINKLEENGLATHAIIILRHDKICYEKYWEPFTSKDLHRMYSQSKSIVSIAVGFAVQDGLMSLDDPIIKYFPKEVTQNASPYVKIQTIRNMLMMSTGFPERTDLWFTRKPKDRVKDYFDASVEFMEEAMIPGTIFTYDSDGSFVLCAAVERVTGKYLMDYLREKLFDYIGVSEEAYCLQCPGGYSWGDSGIMCTPMDMLKIALFVMNHGQWNGKQILNEQYMREATSNLISTDRTGTVVLEKNGYGYQIWKLKGNCFLFSGMGCQYALGIPDKDILFIYNGDNQGNPIAATTIIDCFFDLVVNEVNSDCIDVNAYEYEKLIEYSNNLILHHCIGQAEHKLMKQINNKEYQLTPNTMGIKSLKFVFDGQKGAIEYVNQQGYKKIVFGMGYNEFGLFPQEGYSNDVGSEKTIGYYYRCACSAEWQTGNILHISVQIIDKYFGRLDIFIAFKDENAFSIRMCNSAEDFLSEYTGQAVGMC